jgi:hypothetical protein
MLVSDWVVVLLRIALPLLFYFCVASFSVTLLICFFFQAVVQRGR